MSGLLNLPLSQRSISHGLCLASLLTLLGCGHVGINLDGDDGGTLGLNPEPDAPLKADDDTKEGHDEDTDLRDEDGGETSGKKGRGKSSDDDDNDDDDDDKWDAGDDEASDQAAHTLDSGKNEAPVSQTPDEQLDSGLRLGIPEADASDETDPPGNNQRDSGTSLDPTLSDDSGTTAPSEPDAAADRRDAGLPPAGEEPSLAFCEPECECAAGDECHQSCQSESVCRSVCKPGAVCEIEVGEAHSVEIYCNEGAVCKTDAPTSNQVQFVCKEGGDCHATCGETQECGLSCYGTSTCTLDCAGAAACEMDCDEGAHCIMLRGDNDAETDFECRSENGAECNDGTVVCNKECPEVASVTGAE